MDKVINVFGIFANRECLRIFKLLSKKMLTIEQIAKITGIKENDIQKHINALCEIEVVRTLPGVQKTYFSKAQDAIFNSQTKAITGLIHKWFNQDKTIIDDFYKMNNVVNKKK